MNINSFSGDISDGNEEHAIWNWRKGYRFYNVYENWAELFAVTEWKM